MRPTLAQERQPRRVTAAITIPGYGVRVHGALTGPCETGRMTNVSQHAGEADRIPAVARPGAQVALHVLVVDDSALDRRILASTLRSWGYRVTEAASAPQALGLGPGQAFDLVLSDWMMPDMDGPSFCRAFKAQPQEAYGYFILLTSKSEKQDVAHGLDSGADDFVSKPVDFEELRARLRAGARVVRMERELRHKNRIVTETLTELRAARDAVERDLEQARKLQQSLLPDRFRRFTNGQVALELHPSGHVGGDLVGCYSIGSGRVGIYGLDVAGHGVSSALMTARLAGLLSDAAPERNIALSHDRDGRPSPRDPAQVIAAMNELVLAEMTTDLYFTMVLADVDLDTGHTRLVQAGHPHPVVQRRMGKVELVGEGGFPVGLLKEAAWRQTELKLGPGDRLLILSDGVTERRDPDGEQFGEDRLCRLLGRLTGLHGGMLHNALLTELRRFGGGEEAEDDVSLVLLERHLTAPG